MSAAIEKRFATLRAQAALRGIAVQRIENDEGREVFIASRWAFTRELADLDALEDFLTNQGVPTGNAAINSGVAHAAME